MPLLILDEPTNTLDPTMRDELLAQLREARDRGQAVLFSSHVLAEVEQVCDRVGILQRGKLVHLQIDGRAERGGAAGPRPLPPAAGAMARLAGLGSAADTDGREARLTHRGPLPPLLDWLGRQPVADLRIEPLGLAAVYPRYHGAEA